VAVVEVGLGGRLDATNLVIPAVSIITTISKDHEAYLGSNLRSIAQEKGGIIKAGVPVILGSMPSVAATALETIAQAKGSAGYLFGRDFSVGFTEDGQFDYEGLRWSLMDLSLALRGIHQRFNAAVALAALEVTRRDFLVSERAVREGLERVFWPARFEVILHHPRVILDGAHNSQGVKALAKELREFLGGKRVKLLFGTMKDKDWSDMLQELSKVSSEVLLTRVPMVRSADPSDLISAVPAGLSVSVIEDPAEAITALIGRVEEDQNILVAGSLYLSGHVRPMLLGMRRSGTLEAGVPQAGS
jgi:dihydrofolate synthase/folylpolyglutamate synthase